MRSRVAAVVVAVAVALLAPAGIARADGGSASSEDQFVWPPTQSTHGRWLPVPAAFYEGGDIDACGTTVFYGPGRVRALQYNASFLRDGTEVVAYRGHATSDLVRASDGATLNEIPNDGPGFEVYSADGGTETYTFSGPGIFPAFSPVEVTAFQRAGLPALAIFRAGVLSLQVRYSADTGDEVSAKILVNRTVGLVDGCTLLDRVAPRR